MGAPPFPRPPENDVYSESRKKIAEIVINLLSGVKIKYLENIHLDTLKFTKQWNLP